MNDTYFDNLKKVINSQEPVKMDLDEYLGLKGLSSPISDFMLDKTRIPKGETFRQRQRRIKDTERAIEDYSQRRNDAIDEYNTKVAEGEFIPKTQFERTLKKAQGHPDNASVQAARRLLVKRGFMSEQELNQNIKKWDEKILQKVVVEEKGSIISYEPKVIIRS